MSDTTLSIFRFTDGTDEVDLLDPSLGNWLKDWRPSVQQAKQGGIWQNSPVADGRALVGRYLDNAIESLTLVAGGSTQDSCLRTLHRLIDMMEDAVKYRINGWSDGLVWVEVQAACETNTNYALIWNYQLGGLSNPIDQPFFSPFGGAQMEDVELSFERGEWLEAAPRVMGNNLLLGTTQIYDGRTFGNVDEDQVLERTVENEVFISNKYNEAQLTHIYTNDTIIFGPNLLDAALPYDLIVAPGGATYATYFGIDTSVDDAGPFCSIVFDIGTAGSGLNDLQWQYWNGGWVELDVGDETALGGEVWDTVGVNAVIWRPPSDWVAVARNGVTACILLHGPMSKLIQTN